MSQVLNVSRNTIREAYKILEAFGLLVIKHGTGVFIAPGEDRIHKMTSSFFISSHQVKDLFAVRKILEINGVNWAFQNLSKEKQDLLMSNVKRAKEAANDTPDIPLLSKLDHQFHLTIAEMSQNPVLLRLMHILIDLLEEIRLTSFQTPGRVTKSVDEHYNIAMAIKENRFLQAQEYMKFHLESVENSIITKLKKGIEDI